jgi:hypothetical protein
MRSYDYLQWGLPLLPGWLYFSWHSSRLESHSCPDDLSTIIKAILTTQLASDQPLAFDKIWWLGRPARPPPHSCISIHGWPYPTQPGLLGENLPHPPSSSVHLYFEPPSFIRSCPCFPSPRYLEIRDASFHEFMHVPGGSCFPRW